MEEIRKNYVLGLEETWCGCYGCEGTIGATMMNSFIDTNENFSLEEDEVAFPNQYATFSPRLLRAAFNYQFSIKESAGYVHNGKYILQLLNDSIQDLAQNTALDLPPLIRPE